MFDLALLRAGYTSVGACEIDKFARRVYADAIGAPDYFPSDITTIKVEEIPDADVWIGGSPCQDFSVAGVQKGLDGLRSSLILTWFRLAKAKKPQWLVIENVPGMLSGGEGEWFKAILDALAESGYRDLAWRILDGQFFGVAQRRRRVFLVARHEAFRNTRNGPGPAAVLFEPEGVLGDPSPGGKKGPGTPRRASRGARVGGEVVGQLEASTGGPDDNDARAGRLIQSYNNTGHGWWQESDVAASVRKGDDNGNGGAREATVLAFYPHSGLDQAIQENIAPPLTIGSGGAGQPPGVCYPSWPKEIAPTLNAHFGEKQGLEDQHALGGAGLFVRGQAGAVRRLTPLECERLQGLPDGWTCLCRGVATQKCVCPDGPRYRAIGNGGVTHVVEWIGRRLAAVHAGRDPGVSA